MGGSQSSEIPGGGSEGYHVLRVKQLQLYLFAEISG